MKIVCLAAFGTTLERGNYRNLKQFIEKAKIWVDGEFYSLCERITGTSEKESYEDLLAREEITYRAPSVDKISRARKGL